SIFPSVLTHSANSSISLLIWSCGVQPPSCVIFRSTPHTRISFSSSLISVIILPPIHLKFQNKLTKNYYLTLYHIHLSYNLSYLTKFLNHHQRYQDTSYQDYLRSMLLSTLQVNLPFYICTFPFRLTFYNPSSKTADSYCTTLLRSHQE